VTHQLLELFEAELIVLVGVEFLKELSRRRGGPHRAETASFRTARAASFRPAGTTTFPTTPFWTGTGTIGSATFTAAAPLARATPAAITEVLTTKFARLLALVITQFAIFVLVETLQHPLVHLFTIGTAFALSRRRFVGWLFGIFICTRNACQRRQQERGAAESN
jgi:hypothetical protein